MRAEKQVILKLENLSKSYKHIKAVNNVSFEVLKGEFFALLGPNGAGKSTIIKMLTTLLKQDSGKIKLNGSQDDVYIRQKIGVVFQENVLDGNLTVKENLLLRGALYIKDEKGLQERYESLKKELFLNEIENQKFKTLSGGQKRRAEIANALFADPEVLLLDEPTTGLDPESRKTVWEIINHLKNKSKLTVILTTHYMEETNHADYVVIINRGEVVAKGSPNQLKKRYAHDILKIVPKDFERLTNFLKSKSLKFSRVADQVVLKSVKVNQVIETLHKNQENIESFEMIKGSMDDMFINVIGEGK